MARRDISGLYFNTDIGPVPTPPGPELTSSKILRRSSRTRSRVTGGMRAILFSSRICPEDVSRRVVYQPPGGLSTSLMTSYSRQRPRMINVVSHSFPLQHHGHMFFPPRLYRVDCLLQRHGEHLLVREHQGIHGLILVR